MEKEKDDDGDDFEIDEELEGAELYLESMLEIVHNESLGRIGHDSDPFNRDGEYDEDVDLNAPIAPTPDILEHFDNEEINREEPENVLKSIDFYFKENPIELMSWKKWKTLVNPYYLDNVELFLDINSTTIELENEIDQIEELSKKIRRNASFLEILPILRNSKMEIVLEFIWQLFESFKEEDENFLEAIVETLEFDLFLVEMINSNADLKRIRPLFENLEVLTRIKKILEKFVEKEKIDLAEIVLRFVAVLIETKIWKKDECSKESIEILKKEILQKNFSENELKILLPLNWFNNDFLI